MYLKLNKCTKLENIYGSNFSKFNHISPFVEGTKEAGSISNGSFVLELKVTRKLLRMVTSATFDCINPNLIPKN